MVGFSCDCLPGIQIVMKPLTCEYYAQAFFLDLGIVLFSAREANATDCPC